MQQRVDWLSLSVFGLSLLGIVLGLTACLGLIVLTLVDVSLGDSASALGLEYAAASLATASLLGIPMAVLTGRKLFQGVDLDRSQPAVAWAALALLFPLAIAAGYLASVQRVLPGILGPLAQVLAAGIPAALIALWMRRLSQPVTPTRSWGHFLMGLWPAPVLALALEAALLIAVVIVLIVGLGSQPRMMDLLQNLGANPAISPERLEQDITTIVLNPWTVVCILGYIAVLVPMLEEAIKALGVVPFLRLRLSPSEAFLGGVLSGLGYALFEALFLPQPGSGWAETMLARVGATLMHAFTAGLTGWALAEAVVRRKPGRLLLAYPIAVAVHGLWNASAVAIGLAGLAAGAAHRQLMDPPYVAVAALAGMLLLVLTILVFVGLPAAARRLGRQPAPEPPRPESSP
jgi:hypothetical protein